MPDAAADVVELDESHIPEELRPRVRAWFKGQIAYYSRIHGPHWPSTREWILDYLAAELRERIEDGRAWHAL